MLNLNCTICSEIFTQTGEVVVTRCGHLFHNSCLNAWLQRSPTCPQCRNPCSNRDINRVYFNLDAGEAPNSIDNGLLNELLDGANIQVKESERNLKKADEEIRLLTQTQHECMETISDVNKKLKQKDVIITSFEDEVNRLAKEIEVWKIKSMNFEKDLREETETRRNNELEVELVKGLLQELKEERDKELPALKRQLELSERNRTELSNMLKTVEEDLVKETQLKKDVELRLVQVEEMTSTIQQNESLLQAEIATLKSDLEAKASVHARTDISSTLDKVQCYLQKEIEMKKLSEELLEQIRDASNDREATLSCNQPVHINQRHLMWLAREKARTAGWMFVWHKDGKILARKDRGERVVHIATADDISKIN